MIDVAAVEQEADALAARVRLHKAEARRHRRSAAAAARELEALRARAAEYGIRLVTAREAQTNDRRRSGPTAGS